MPEVRLSSANVEQRRAVPEAAKERPQAGGALRPSNRDFSHVPVSSRHTSLNQNPRSVPKHNPVIRSGRLRTQRCHLPKLAPHAAPSRTGPFFGLWSPAGFFALPSNAVAAILQPFREGWIMLRISTAIAFTILVAAGLNGISTASADTWGCSYEKCLQVCGKVGGHSCSAYCNKQLKDKQTSKVCK
jgi:hypothetical protein